MKPRFAPFWYDRFPPAHRPSLPRYRADIDTRVAIVGGGLTGCACAYAFAAARIPVVLIEADRLGAGATAGALGLVREDFDIPFGATAAALGLRGARPLWQAMRRAAMDLPALLRRLSIRCDLAPQGLLSLAPVDTTAARQLRRDYEARRDAGIEHRWIPAAAVRRDTALDSGGAIRTRGAVLDPYRACLGLAAAATERGALMFERSEARRIRSGRTSVEVVTSDGTIRAESVIVATGAPIADLRPLRRHLQPRHGYGVVTEPLSAQVRREVGRRAHVLRDAAMPPHFVRWLTDDRVLIEGAVQEPVSPRAQQQALVQRTGQLMYELSLLYPAISGIQPAWGWSYAFDETVDGLPYIGPHRNFPRHLFALGVGRHGPATAWLAARVLLRQFTNEPARGDDLLGFSRILAGR